MVQTMQRYYKYRILFLLLMPAFILTFIFQYVPIYGILIAFKNYRVLEGIWGSPWAGFTHFHKMFTITNDFKQVFLNTVIISSYKLFFGFPAPILLALLLNEVKSAVFKRVTQTISYLPYFLSWIMLAGVITIFLSPSSGLVNQFIQFLGFDPIYFLASKEWFRTVLVSASVWQGMGWGTIIYLAAIAGIDPQLYEAAIIDGAGKFKQAIHITLPSITNVIIIMFILSVGNILNSDFDQIFNLYNPAVYEVGDIIDTYVYRVGLVEMNFSFAAAVNIFKSVISVALVVFANIIAKRFGEYGIW